jgi:hypothetical protein
LLHHFRLEKPLAEGGMGAVYLGYDQSLQRQVAIKVIRPEFAKEPSFVARFLREARAQAQVVHSNVVQVFYVGQEDDTLFMVMELVEGGSLGQALKQSGPLDWRQAHRHFVALSHGLKEGARLGLIHRDIKPDNVLLDRFGEAHLADFGLAAPVRSHEPALAAQVAKVPAIGSLTQVGMVMGSPPYMSPEQAAGRPLDVRSDIYALGATFLELLTGHPPTRAATLIELSQFHQGPPPGPLLPRRGAIAPGFAAIVDRCLARDPNERFQNYDELIAALEAAGPKPLIDAGSLPRALAFAIDASVFVVPLMASAVVSRDVGIRVVLAFVALTAWLLLGAVWCRATPGLWLMRLVLTDDDGQALKVPRLMLRGVVQYAWLFFAGLALAGVYHAWSSSAQLTLAGVSLVFGAVSIFGALWRWVDVRRRTVVDRLFGTRVFVFVR